MSNWWNTSDGTDVTDDAKTEYDSGGGGFEILPAKTRALASIASAGWAKDREDNRYINIQWSIVKHEGYARRVVFQKLWCGDDDPRAKDPKKKRDKALRMLATIDANAGGKLAKAGREPDDDDLALALTNKQMGITLMVWDKEENGETVPGGNWVSAVAPKAGFECTVPPKGAVGGGGSMARRIPADDDLDSDVPFMTCDSMF